MLLITSGVSNLLTTLGHAPLQGHEPMTERVGTGVCVGECDMIVSRLG